MRTILIVDDEKNIRQTLARALRLEGYETLEAENGRQALEQLVAGRADLAIVDLQMPEMDGLELLEALRERELAVPALMLTAHGTIDRAVRAVRAGALDVIEKPPSVERILLSVANALRVGDLERENRRLAEEAGMAGSILGSSKAAQELRAAVARVGPTEATALLFGENGVGKELVARALHEAGPRRRRPLVTVNCAAVPETLFESELFGHQRGAFTGATESRRGKFQQAHGGTLFLDEVGEIPLAMQPKLLRALESGETARVGGGESERVDVRVIAASNRDLAAEVRGGRFREDLFFRLNVVPLRVPTLRERAEDIPELARHFLAAACRRNRVRPKRLDEGALDALRRHSWPGNIRELRNTMERVAILVPGDRVGAEDLAFLAAAPRPASGAPPAGPFDLVRELERVERELVLAVLERCRWRMAKAAAELNLERSHLYKKLKALGIERPTED
jgi:DNA-binding NtrC family response regulator